jgi:hypothetical protein
MSLQEFRPMNHVCWRTAWHGQDIVVFREDEVVDRIHTPDIERVVFVYRTPGETLSDLRYALVQLPDAVAILPLETGFAGRVNFERQAFWSQQACVYWALDSKAPLAFKHPAGRWWLRLGGPTYARMPRQDVVAAIDTWPLEGPQTWEERKRERIAKNRPFADLRPMEIQRVERAI